MGPFSAGAAEELEARVADAGDTQRQGLPVRHHGGLGYLPDPAADGGAEPVPDVPGRESLCAKAGQLAPVAQDHL